MIDIGDFDGRAIKQEWGEALVEYRAALKRHVATGGLDRALTLLIKARAVNDAGESTDDAALALAACIGIMECVQSICDENEVLG